MCRQQSSITSPRTLTPASVELSRITTALETLYSSITDSEGRAIGLHCGVFFAGGCFLTLIPCAARLYSQLLWSITFDIFRSCSMVARHGSTVIPGFV